MVKKAYLSKMDREWTGIEAVMNRRRTRENRTDKGPYRDIRSGNEVRM